MPVKWGMDDTPVESGPVKWGLNDTPVTKSQATEKPRPTFVSRFLQSTVDPIRAVSDSIQASMRSQNPVGDLASKVGGVVSNAAQHPLDTAKAMAQPFVDVGGDLMNGDFGAAAGGATGLLLPFLPKGMRAVGAVDGAAIMAGAKGAAKGAASGGIEALMGSARRPLTAMDLLVPGAKKAKLGAEAAAGIYQGAKAGKQQAMTVLELQRRQSANAPRVPVTVDPVVDAPADLTPIPSELPSGRRPLTQAERIARAESPTTKAPPAPAKTLGFDPGEAADFNPPRESYGDKVPKRTGSRDFYAGEPASSQMPKESYKTAPSKQPAVEPTGPSPQLLDDISKGFPDHKPYAKRTGVEQKAIQQMADDVENPKPAPESKYAKIPEGKVPKTPGERMARKEIPPIVEYPQAKGEAGGFKIRNSIPNWGSVEASLGNYEELSGIRDFPINHFENGHIKPKSLDARTAKLASEIQASKELNPLIVVIDEKGPYILEGGHRYDAIKSIGAKSFPAKVIIDRDSLPATAKAPKTSAIEPESTIAGKSPELQQLAKDLADSVGDTGSKVEGAQINVHREAAQAGKAWNVADSFENQFGIERLTPETIQMLREAPQSFWKDRGIDVANSNNFADLKNGVIKIPHKIHRTPSSPKSWQELKDSTIKTLEERIEARKATNQ